VTTDHSRQQLHYIITHYGRSICDEPKRFEALLKDLCPHHKREVFLLVAALREGIAKELLKPSQLLPVESIFRLMVQKLDENLGIAQHHAQWAVESWAFALGIKFNSAAIAPSPDKGKTGMGSPQIATPIMPVDHAAALQQIKQQQAQSRASQAMIDQFKGWQKIGLQGEKLAVDAPQWAAVVDEKTKLMWAVNSSEAVNFPHQLKPMTWDDAKDWVVQVNSLSWCGCSNWRLPTIDELKTLLLPKKYKNLHLREDVFTDINTNSYWVWSSSLVAGNSNYAWIVSFDNGYGSHYTKYVNHYVRLVRSSQ
jgi:hypothetical protein